jgi:hypothetical protein
MAGVPMTYSFAVRDTLPARTMLTGLPPMSDRTAVPPAPWARASGSSTLDVTSSPRLVSTTISVSLSTRPVGWTNSVSFCAAKSEVWPSTR